MRITDYSGSHSCTLNEKSAKEDKFNWRMDTSKISDSIAPIIHYVIAGSFLVPKNADTQLQKLKKLGFTKSYKYNFPDTEYYSVVVDTFKVATEYLELTEKLQKNSIAYFIKTK